MSTHDPGNARGGAKSISVFAWIDARHRFLLDTYDQLLLSPDRKHISRCLYLAHQIQGACKQHKDGLLAALQLNRNPQYQHVKELFVGVLCEQLGQQAGLSPSARLLLICAALTQDIAMLDLQDNKLDRQATGLTEGQRAMIRKHPTGGRRILERAGVKDAVWLEAVEQHHERPDGKGYPQGLAGSEIALSARILTVADVYVAMVRPRGDRPALSPREAIKNIFRMRDEQVDADIARSLADTLGMHPPGSWVRLINDEVGVVTGAGTGHPFPEVAVILSSDGEHLAEPELRDTGIRRFTVAEMVKAPFHFNLSAILSGLWPRLS
ncbi:HD-GYP domain-containing protein [Motiliproteus sp. SC1-56]|uniref:HD-GYP domain-containing protein n=1 Tax=Motiliproteus sp. SC1-56 TaxID=2799565 RepID=UPI001A8F0364|nr:HD domain-containing phosphohydrolase [Motiliproteus sp. SC1-56]